MNYKPKENITSDKFCEVKPADCHCNKINCPYSKVNDKPKKKK